MASAGSGKTSTMVAKAAYAIHRGFVAPERVILLAFNKQAAEELKERAEAFERLGMEGVSVEASTFHALAFASSARPPVRNRTFRLGYRHRSGFRKLTDIIDQLKDSSLAFRAQWDLFRFVLVGICPRWARGPPDAWDDQGNGLTLTADGTQVRSLEEATLSTGLLQRRRVPLRRALQVRDRR